MLVAFGVFFFAYLIGSIPTGLLVGKGFFHVDLRTAGSHNIGATNAWRLIGKKAGIIIFAGDFLKGFVSSYLGFYFFASPLYTLLAGIFAVLGHTFSIFLKFKGGKGVATGLGVIAFLMPQVTVFVFLLWFLIVYFTGYVSLASIIAAIFVPPMTFLFDYPFEYITLTGFIALFIVYRHRTNIQRLLHGTESKIKAKK